MLTSYRHIIVLGDSYCVTDVVVNVFNYGAMISCYEFFSPNINKVTGIYMIIIYICVCDNAIEWKYFPCYWSFVRGIHR